MNRTVLCAALLLVGWGCRGQGGSGPSAPSSSSTATPLTPPKPTEVAPTATSATTAPAATAAPSNAITVWSFDGDKADAAPAGFSFGRTGNGKEGRWVVQAASDAPSKGNVLAQLDADATDFRFPVAVVGASSFQDVRLSVWCKPISGKVDQACGLVWRFKDANNYYLTRANALEGNVRLYRVKDGNRVELASWSGKVASKTWHRVVVEAKGDRFVVTFDEQPVLDARDATFREAGNVGVWTKADSVTQFDDLQASAL